MLTEFAFLTALTLRDDEREAQRGEIDKWIGSFLPKLERKSTRTEKCRLIASVERYDFENDDNARDWRYFKIIGNNGILFDEDKKELEKAEFKATSFQREILSLNPSLNDVFIGRSEIKEETGNWKLDNELKGKLIYEGGEAIVLNWTFGKREMAVRIQVFDAFLFTQTFAGQIKWKTHLISDFKTATNKEKDNAAVAPVHKNVIRNYANIEIFKTCDVDEQDCIGWITIMEKCETNLREELKKGNPNLEKRKKIAYGIQAGLDYLDEVGISHMDKKLANFLLIGDVVKICDFGLVWESSGRSSYKKLGYARNGSKYKNGHSLYSGTPGFAIQYQLGGAGNARNEYFLYPFCDWKTIWYLNYAPIDDKEREKIDKVFKNCGVQDLFSPGGHFNQDHVMANITKIISLPNASGSFSIDDPNLTKSVNMSNWKQQMTKCVNLDIRNLSKNILDQKSSNLCVPISVTALLQFAIKNDLGFEEKNSKGVYEFTSERILTTLTMIVYPRSLAGLNLNPKKEEKEFQGNDIETLLERICQKTYLKKSGWELIRQGGTFPKPAESTCDYKQVLLNENFVFSRPLTVTGACLLPARIIDGQRFSEEVIFHQMTLDRIENGEYVLQNTQFSNEPEAGIVFIIYISYLLDWVE